MLLPTSRQVEKRLGVAAGIVLLLCFSFVPQFGIQALCLLFLLVALLFLARFQDIHCVVNELAVLLMSWLYIPLLMSFFVLLHGMDHGRHWVLMVLIMTMVCDSTAYFVGTAFGKHRLYPAISPKKSIEGAVGGFVGSVASAVFICPWLIPESSLVTAAIVGAVVGFIGQLGDLFESMIKRNADIKDSGTIFPGHGGMLDRLDSLLFAFPCAYLCLYWL